VNQSGGPMGGLPGGRLTGNSVVLCNAGA